MNGHTYRLVDNKSSIHNSHSARLKLKQLAMTQKSYIGIVVKLTSEELIDINMPVMIETRTGESITVREFLMSQKYHYKGSNFRVWKVIERHYS